jgi:tetratricopeptide (TPR) repeat protein
MVYLGFFEEAERLYKKAISLNPFHPDSYFTYGALIYLELGQFEKSLALAKKASLSIWVDLPAFMAAACYHLSDLENMRAYWNVFLNQYKCHTQSKEPSEEEAVKWLLIVNPYRGKTKFEEFLEYIIGKPLQQSATSAPKEDRVQEASFIQKNEIWELSFQGKSVQMKDARGLHDMAKLLSAPEQEIHCTALMGTVLENREETVAIDQKAKAAYQKRIRELQTEIQDAEAMNNTAQLATLREEYEWLLDHLSQSLGLAGKAREVGSSVEKARSAVTWRIRSTIKKIEKVHPSLAKHLSNAIHTGTFCVYKPEQPVHWII